MITARDIEWGAGFFEGEGSVIFHQRLVCVEVQQTQQWALEKMRDLFGGKIYLRKKPSQGSRQVTWTWHCDGMHGVSLMMTLYSLLSPRRQYQIQQVLLQWRAVPTRMKTILLHQKRREQLEPR